ncbi:fimbria/pilus periplasmic chaperone [Citrobacter koseri]|nr:fimbria/pilus periplasmic chaperone [Citrobacter koseri]
MAIFLALGVSSFGVHAEGQKQTVEKKEQPFAVKLGATRVIYSPDSGGATLTVSNPQDYPMLVKSQVIEEDKKTAAPFIVTPPLFRLDGQQQSRLRIINTGGGMPSDRETLQWLCVTGIPPKADDAWAQDGGGKSKPDHATLNVQISVSSCIKLLVRPSNIRGAPTDVASSLVWTREGGQMKVNNPTPFYMNLKSVSVGGKDVDKLEYIPPFSSKMFALPQGASGEISWQMVTDLGGVSKTYKAELQ